MSIRQTKMEGTSLDKNVDLNGIVAFIIAALSLAVALFPDVVPGIQIWVRVAIFIVGITATGYLLLRERSWTEQMKDTTREMSITTTEMKNAIQKISSEFSVKELFDFLKKKKCVYNALYIEAKRGKNRVGVGLNGLKFYPINPFDPSRRPKANKRSLPKNATWRYLRIEDVPSVEKLDDFKMNIEQERGIKILSCYLIDLVSHVARDNNFYVRALEIANQNPEMKRIIVERAVLEQTLDLSDIRTALKEKA